MNTIAFTALNTNNTSKVLASIKAGTFINELKLMTAYYGHGNFDLLKKSISLLLSLCDFQNEYLEETSLATLKQLSKGILDEVIAPLLSDLRASKPSFPTKEELKRAQILSKF